MITANKFDALIDEAIKELASDNVTKGAECLQDIATYWAKGGLPIENFMELRQYIVNEAIKKTDKNFITEKLVITERTLREARTKTVIILN